MRKITCKKGKRVRKLQDKRVINPESSRRYEKWTRKRIAITETKRRRGEENVKNHKWSKSNQPCFGRRIADC